MLSFLLSSAVAHAGWTLAAPAPRHLQLTQAAAVHADCVAAIGDGELLWLAGDAWQPLGQPATQLYAAEGDLWAVAPRQQRSWRLGCDGTLTRARAALPPPPPPPTSTAALPEGMSLVGVTAEGVPLACGEDGCRLYLERRASLVHTNEPDGSRQYSYTPEPAAWVWAPAPRELIAVLPTQPALLVGRYGAVSWLELGQTGGYARSRVPGPDGTILAMRALDGGRSVLVVTDHDVLRDGAALPLSAAVRAWLHTVARDAPGSALEVYLVGLSADRALLAWKDQGLYITPDEVTAIPIVSSSPGPEVVGLVALGGERWAALTHTGTVIRGQGGQVGRSERLDDFQHPVGAFPDAGGARMVPSSGTTYCVQPDLTEGCGPGLEERVHHAYPLEGGLFVQTQGIAQVQWTSAGLLRYPRLPGNLRAAAGTAEAPVLLMRFAGQRADDPDEIWAWSGARWEVLATVPCRAAALDADGSTVWAACPDGAVHAWARR